MRIAFDLLQTRSRPTRADRILTPIMKMNARAIEFNSVIRSEEESRITSLIRIIINKAAAVQMHKAIEMTTWHQSIKAAYTQSRSTQHRQEFKTILPAEVPALFERWTTLKEYKRLEKSRTSFIKACLTNRWASMLSQARWFKGLDSLWPKKFNLSTMILSQSREVPNRKLAWSQDSMTSSQSSTTSQRCLSTTWIAPIYACATPGA